ncbi:MAG: PHP domain-containing protein [Chloroflexi bacterium]|nr:PHP domain-containing protein [Chloroflexota bacterium]
MLEIRYWKVDFHVHTCYSGDSLTSLEAVIEACRGRGLDKVAITDHNTIAGALALSEMAPDLVIVGEEIKTKVGEIIAYFLTEEVPKGLPLEEAIARVRQQGGVVGVPHPLDRLRREALGRTHLLSIIEQVDLLEVFNARTVFPADNRRALELAREHGLLATAGSDAHTPGEIGQAYVEMPAFNDRDEFLRSLAEGQIVGRLTSPLIHLVSTWAKLVEKLRG